MFQVSRTNTTVTDLIPGREYLFRVKALNKKGAGRGITTNQAIVAHETASAPPEVAVLEMCKDGAKLKWSTPTNDGGSKITKYRIEAKCLTKGKQSAWSVKGSSTDNTSVANI